MRHFISGFSRLRFSKASVLFFGFFVLSACEHEHEVTLTYNCVPSGARIIEEGVGDVGYCPAVLKYSSLDAKVKGDTLYTNKTYVYWPSGASLLVAPGELDIGGDRKASVTFYRPEDHPDFEKDTRLSADFEKDVVTPKTTYVFSRDQDRDGFASLNRYASCAWSGMTRSAVAQCE